MGGINKKRKESKAVIKLNNSIQAEKYMSPSWILQNFCLLVKPHKKVKYFLLFREIEIFG